VNLTVAQINKIYNTTVFRWLHTATGLIFLGALEFIVPPELAPYTTPPSYQLSSGYDAVTCTYPCTTRNRTTTGSGVVPKRAIDQTPEEGFHVLSVQRMKDYYNWRELNESLGEGATVSVLATIEQTFSENDNYLWDAKQFQSFRRRMTSTKGPIGSCDSDKWYNCIEGNLDIQWILALARDARSTFWSVPWSPFSNPFLKYVRDLAADKNAPDVHSISYLNAESEVHPDQMALFNSEVCKLGLRGITVIVASGDDGAPGKEGCKGGPNRECKLTASFPANCPFVTTVGATMGPEKSLNAEEVALSPTDKNTDWSAWDPSSAGAFSTFFPRPSWQYRVVKKYLSSPYNVAPGNTNTSGRAYPDVSFMGYHYEIFLNGTNVTVSGTSASAPAFASLITLINGIRMKRGLHKLGFLNPLLYNKILSKSSYNDIVTGNNTCCMGGKLCCPHGWYTAPGWDPVTGLGTPNIGKWLDILLTDFHLPLTKTPGPKSE